MKGRNALKNPANGRYPALTLRDRDRPAIIRWSQSNEPGNAGTDSAQFEKDLYTAMNGNDGARPVSVDAGPGAPANPYSTMTYSNFDVVGHYLDVLGNYGEQVVSVPGRPDGEGEYIWPACNTKQGFEWFATATAAKRGKDASDLRLCDASTDEASGLVPRRAAALAPFGTQSNIRVGWAQRGALRSGSGPDMGGLPQ